MSQRLPIWQREFAGRIRSSHRAFIIYVIVALAAFDEAARFLVVTAVLLLMLARARRR